MRETGCAARRRPLHPGEHLIHAGEILVGRPLGRQRRHLHFDHHTGFECFKGGFVGFDLEANLVYPLGGGLADIDPAARTDFQLAARCQALQGFTHHRAADAELSGEIVLRRQRITGTERLVAHVVLDTIHDYSGQGASLDRSHLSGDYDCCVHFLTCAPLAGSMTR